jgi:hypothetical protein
MEKLPGSTGKRKNSEATYSFGLESISLAEVRIKKGYAQLPTGRDCHSRPNIFLGCYSPSSGTLVFSWR